MSITTQFVTVLPTLPTGYRQLWADYETLMTEAPGSRKNHQAWSGGYSQHLDEMIGLHRMLRPLWASRVPLASVAEVDLIIGLHDLEKPFKYTDNPYRDEAHADSDGFKQHMMDKYGIVLSEKLYGAYNDIHYGTVSPTASLVHACDILSARLWHNQPQQSGPLTPADIKPHLVAGVVPSLYQTLSAARALPFSYNDMVAVMDAWTFGMPLTDEAHGEALHYIDGESDAQRAVQGPTMSPLAVVCHVSAQLVTHARAVKQ